MISDHVPAMKWFLVLVIVPVLTVCLIAGCGREVNIYYNPEQTISVRTNHEFIIATATNPPTGYMWRETFDENMLELTASTIEASEAVKQGEAKIGLEQHFRFKALKQGKTEIRIDLAGPDPKFSIERKIFNVNIK